MFRNKRNIYLKDPLPVGIARIRNGGAIQTMDETNIISVDSSGDVTITGDIHATAGSIGTTELANAGVTLVKLATGIKPSHITVYSGEVTWTGGGASIATTVTGALASDIVTASIQSAPTEAAYIASVAVTADTVTTTLSTANTSNDAVIAYKVERAVS